MLPLWSCSAGSSSLRLPQGSTVPQGLLSPVPRLQVLNAQGLLNRKKRGCTKVALATAKRAPTKMRRRRWQPGRKVGILGEAPTTEVHQAPRSGTPSHIPAPIPLILAQGKELKGAPNGEPEPWLGVQLARAWIGDR